MGLFNVKIHTIYKYISGAILIIDELLIALGVKADTKKLDEFEKGLDGVSDSAEQTESSMLKAYDATDSFVSEIGKAVGIVTFFTGVLGGALGVFHSTIMEIEELIKEEKLLTKVTKEQVEQSKKYKESVEGLGKRFQSLKVELAFGFLPTMQRTINKLDEFLKANKDAIVNGITAFVNGLLKVVQVITNTVRFIDLIITSTVGWKNALLILVGVLAWVKRAMILAFITNPVTWIIAAIAGLLLLIDDFMTYLDGGESEFGEFWGSMLGWVNDNKDALLALKDMFMNVLNFIAGAVALVVGLFTGNTYLMQAAWEGMVESLKAAWSIFSDFAAATGQVIAEAIKKAFGVAKNYIVGILNQIVSAISNFISRVGSVIGIIQGVIIAPFKAAFDWIANKFGELPSMISKATSLMTFGLSDKAASAVSNIRNRITNNTTSVNANINVNGTTSPQATAKAVGANLNSMTKSNVGGAAVA